MSETFKPRLDFDETIAKFPDFTRARELYITLFKDRTPLVNLGYTSRQIEFSIPTLRLLEEEGKVNTDLGRPYLDFQSPDNPDEGVEIDYLLNGLGFYLFAHNDTTLLDNPPGTGRLIYALFGSRMKVLDDIGGIARIVLFQDTSDINSLDYLIPQLHNNLTEGMESGVRRENILTKTARALRLTTTYRGAWVDERTKLEFVVEINDPQYTKLGLEPDYDIWRRLNSVSDNQGSMVPFGKKPNISQEKVKDVLSAAQNRVTSGKLVLGRAQIYQANSLPR